MIYDQHTCGLNHPVLCQDCADKLKSELSRLESDALTMALRLYGEDDNTFSSETRSVMARWRPRCDAVLSNSMTSPKEAD